MANITLGWNNRTDSGTLSGGSWQTTLPLTNLQNRQVQKVARSTNATLTSTQFQIDLGQARSIGAVALVVHNISVSGEVRVTGADSLAAFTNALTFPDDLRSTAEAGATRPWSQFVDVSTQVTLTTDTAPNGTSGASKLAAADVGFVQRQVSQTFTATDNSSVTMSIMAKAAECTRLSMVLGTKDPLYPGAIFDLSAGTVASTYASGAASLTSASIADAGGGWWKCTIVGNVRTGATPAAMTMQLTSTSNSFFTSTSAGQGLLLTNAQVILGAPTIYDSQWQNVWPSGVIPQSLLEWEEDNFWLGTLSSNARAGYQSPYILLLPAAQNLRYWKIEVSDTSNSDGYIQIGRLFMSSVWTPTVNYSFGAGLGYQDPTPIDVSLSGAEYFDVRPRYRVFSFELRYILNTEAYGNAIELQRLSGTSGEVLVVPDSADTQFSTTRSFVGRLFQLGEVTQPQPSAFSARFQIKELL